MINLCSPEQQAIGMMTQMRTLRYTAAETYRQPALKNFCSIPADVLLRSFIIKHIVSMVFLTLDSVGDVRTKRANIIHFRGLLRVLVDLGAPKHSRNKKIIYWREL